MHKEIGILFKINLTFLADSLLSSYAKPPAWGTSKCSIEIADAEIPLQAAAGCYAISSYSSNGMHLHRTYSSFRGVG